MHARGWRSIYCIPQLPAFKGSAPINLSDRLNQVLRWALGSVEILLSRHCPIWYGYGGRLKWLERFAYVNTTIYPVTSIPLLAYCALPAVCLLTGKFFIPQVSTITLLPCEHRQFTWSKMLFRRPYETFELEVSHQLIYCHMTSHFGRRKFLDRCKNNYSSAKRNHFVDLRFVSV